MTHVPLSPFPSPPLPSPFSSPSPECILHLSIFVFHRITWIFPPPCSPLLSPPLSPPPTEISSTGRMKYTSRSRERTRGMTLFPGLLIWIKLRLSGGIKTFDMPLTSRSFHVNQTVAVYFVKRNLIARNSPPSPPPSICSKLFSFE